MRGRNEAQPVFDDIVRLERQYTESGIDINAPVDMPDTMCLAYQPNDDTRVFSKGWASIVWTTSMREQLSFNVEVNKSPLKSNLDVRYIDWSYAK